MKTTINNLSNQELELYNYTVSLQEMTDMDNIDKKLEEDGIFSQYRHIHKSYLDLFLNTENEETKLEILKRLVFLNWYDIIEPSCFTGIKDLDSSIIFESYSILNEYLIRHKIDEEFKWMLSYYSSWDFAILPFSENNLNALTRFVKEVDTAVLSCPKKQLPKGSMDNKRTDGDLLDQLFGRRGLNKLQVKEINDMPIIRISDQKKETLEEFYKELTNEKATSVENEIGKTMLSFLSMVNNIFLNTTIYGCTSHYSLCIQSEDYWESDFYVVIQGYSDQKFQLEYKIPEAKSPWKYAMVKGQANTIDEAKDFLIIAMTESGGWSDNKELRNLYHKLKGIKTENPIFKLWLEFEEVAPDDWNINDDFCNIHVDLEDGRHYGLNIWTYKFLEKVVNQDSSTGQNLSGIYQIPPDLFVKELTRECIEKTIEDLLKIGDLEKLLNRSID